MRLYDYDVIMIMIWCEMNQKQNQNCWAIAGTIPHISNNIEHLWWGLCEMTYTPKLTIKSRFKIDFHGFCALESLGVWMILGSTGQPHEGPRSGLWELQIRSKEQPAWGRVGWVGRVSWWGNHGWSANMGHLGAFPATFPFIQGWQK